MRPPEHPPWHPRSWPTLAKATTLDSRDDRVLGLGAEVAFFSLLSLPPTLLAVFGTVGYVAQALGPQAAADIRDRLLDGVSPFLTGRAQEGLGSLLDRFLEEGQAGVASVGVVLALWSASRATKVFMEAVHIAYDTTESRTGLRRRAVAFGITLLGIFGAVVVIPLIVAGPRVGRAIGRPVGLESALATAWRIAYWPGVGLLGIALLASFYHFALSARTPWLRDLPGAVLAAGLWFAGAAGLRLYVSMTIENNTTYGSLAAPIAILLWLYVTALALLVGAELNAEIEKLWPADESDPIPDDRAQTPVPPPGDGWRDDGSGLRSGFSTVTKRVETMWRR